MKLSAPVRNIILIWLGWAIVLLSFQSWVQMRVNLMRPDRALNWTITETNANSNKNKPYLIDPFLNSQVAWDSEFYLAIANEGYESASIPSVPVDFDWGRDPHYCRTDQSKDCTSLSYAFFPLYPLLARLVALPLKLIPMTPIANATLGAVIVSLLGTLIAMLSLYFMTRKNLGEDGGIRAAFYLLIFPSGFFLAQVYTEGLFIGITFAALAFLTARKWGWAALCAALAVWTRPGGAILVLPMIIIWIMDRTWREKWSRAAFRGLAALSPVISYGIWTLTPLARHFFMVEKVYFQRGLLALNLTLISWQEAYQTMLHGSPPSRFYYGLEFAAILLGIITCLWLIKERPELAIYGLAVIVFSFTTGPAQGMVRYVLAAPPLFWVLSRWGKNTVFDRVWTLLSILIMGLEVMLFTFDFWVA